MTVPYSAIMQIVSPGAYREGWLKEGARGVFTQEQHPPCCASSVKYIFVEENKKYRNICGKNIYMILFLS